MRHPFSALLHFADPCRLAAAGIALTTVLSACVGGPLPDLTVADARYGRDSDETRLIKQARQANAELSTRGLIHQDPVLQVLVERTGRQVVPAAAARNASFRFNVLRDPSVNAMALPDGTIYVTIGLLARLDSEAQLAQVLSHEVSHVVQRHGIKSYRSRKFKTVSSHIADLALFGSSLAYVPFVASIASHSREQEEQADRMGLELMSHAGYSLGDTSALYSALAEIKGPESRGGSIWASHPANAKRAAYTAKMLNQGMVSELPNARLGREEYRPARLRAIREYIELKLNIRHYELAKDAAEAATVLEPGSAWWLYYRGEAYRRMAEDPNGAAREHAWLYGKEDNDELRRMMADRAVEFSALAARAFQEALDRDPGFAPAFRGRGLLSARSGDPRAARRDLEYYLSRSPSAGDRPYVESVLEEIKR